jgi:hypothetical protein
MLGMLVESTFHQMDNSFVQETLMEEFGSGTGEQQKITGF